jgi:hypothetical protein
MYYFPENNFCAKNPPNLYSYTELMLNGKSFGKSKPDTIISESKCNKPLEMEIPPQESANFQMRYQLNIHISNIKDAGNFMTG